MHQEIDPDKSHLEEIEGDLCRWGWGALGGERWWWWGGILGKLYASAASSGYQVLEKAIDLVYVHSQ